MAHHFEETPDELKPMIRQTFDQQSLQLGATGEFPDGKIHENDEGEIKFAIAGDESNNLVHIDFGDKPIACVSMTAEQAIEVAQCLIKHARKVATTPLHISIT